MARAWDTLAREHGQLNVARKAPDAKLPPRQSGYASAQPPVRAWFFHGRFGPSQPAGGAARLPLRHPRAAARPPRQSLGRTHAQRLNWRRAAQHLPGLYCANGEDELGHHCDEARRIAAPAPTSGEPNMTVAPSIANSIVGSWVVVPSAPNRPPGSPNVFTFTSDGTIIRFTQSTAGRLGSGSAQGSAQLLIHSSPSIAVQAGISKEHLRCEGR